MGNWHCVTSDCATVVYREYLPPLVRWRYPEEDWQEIIEADDYSLEQDWYGGQNPNIQYRYKYGRAAISGGVLVGWATFYSSKPSGVIFPISDLRLLIKGVDYNQYEHWAFKGGGSGNPPPDGSRSRRYIMQVKDATGTWKSWLNTSSQGHRVYGLEPADGSIENNPGGSNCIFTVTKNGEIVHQETPGVCPEVEQLPCRLSDVYKEIKIDKVPYLSAIEVVPFARDADKVNGVPYPLPSIKPIPNECLNIYRNEAFDPLPGGNSDLENEPVFADYITQICSAPSCPPPEYEVICDCIERCPPLTCEVVCGDKLCCYGSDGKARKSIPLSNFFPTNTTGGNPR